MEQVSWEREAGSRHVGPAASGARPRCPYRRVLRCRWVASLSLFVCVGAWAWPQQATAQQVPSPSSVALEEEGASSGSAGLEWGDRPRFSVAESVSTGVMTVGLMALHFGDIDRDGAPWTGKVFFDEGTRSGLRARSAEGRRAAASLSDALLYTLMLYPYVVDTGLAALAAHRSPDVAAQMFLINTQAFALTSLVTTAVKGIAQRERPYGRNCRDGGDGGHCQGDGRYASFFSGHTSMAFTGAGLICAHHTNLPLYGSRAADRAACFTAVGAATTVGAMRMVADKHYLSDVLLGAAVGVLSGYVMPTLLHYRHGGDDEGQDEASLRGNLAPTASPSSVGLSYSGIF